MYPLQELFLREFKRGKICLSITKDDSDEDIITADHMIRDSFGRYIGFGAKSISSFVINKVRSGYAKEIQIAYNYFNDGLLGFTDNPMWYPERGINPVPLIEFVGSDVCADQDHADDGFESVF